MNKIQDLKLYNFISKIYIQHIKYFWYNIFYIIL